MWMFFEDGTFYSAVDDEKDFKAKWVRTRDLRSAELFADWLELERATDVEILRWKHRDYAFRVKATRDEWEQYVLFQLDSACATNFKNKAKENGASRAFLDALSSVWSVMFNYQYDELNPVPESKGKKKGKRGHSHNYATDTEFFDEDDLYNSGDEGWQNYMAWLERNAPTS